MTLVVIQEFLLDTVTDQFVGSLINTAYLGGRLKSISLMKSESSSVKSRCLRLIVNVIGTF